jgi:hypothetical protein
MKVESAYSHGLSMKIIDWNASRSIETSAAPPPKLIVREHKGPQTPAFERDTEYNN